MQLAFDFSNDFPVSVFVTPKAVKVTAKAPIKEPVKLDNSPIIAKLEANLKSLIEKRDSIDTSVHGNHTARRQRFADNRMRDKDILTEYSAMMERLIYDWKNNSVHPLLLQIRSYTQAKFIIEHVFFTDEEIEVIYWKETAIENRKKLIKLGIKTKDEYEIAVDVIKDYKKVRLSPEEIKKRELDKTLAGLRSSNIPGFFPTPDELIHKMIRMVNINSRSIVLEPSAGIGSIVDVLKEQFPGIKVMTAEIVSTLIEVLELKGYTVWPDIFNTPVMNVFDVIIMNPPFEKQQDIKHVMYCYENFLQDGGELVSIMSG